MKGFDRIALEQALRTEGAIATLGAAAIHNVRITVGASELYGREDWMALEARRFASEGPKSVDASETISAPLGNEAMLVAARWRLGSAPTACAGASLSMVHANRIVREWQFVERFVSRLFGDKPSPRRFGIPWEYGEVRAALGQTLPADDANVVAAAGIASHPVVEHWHRRWNRRSPDTTEFLAPFADPVMFCERLVVSADARNVALQWRLVGRHVAEAWGFAASHARLELPGLSFFHLDGVTITARNDHYDLSVLTEQIAQRASAQPRPA